MLKRAISWFLALAKPNPPEKTIDMAKRVLDDRGCSTFTIVSLLSFFPPQAFLNEFLMSGSDPCDQDGLTDWQPFSVSNDEYEELKAWWIFNHSGTVEDNLGVNCWRDWMNEVADRYHGLD